VTGATSYTLQEDDDAAFSSPTTVYDHGAGITWSASGQAPGTYYYRVKATGAGGDSPWSSTQSVQVNPPPPAAPTLNPISNPDGDGNYTVTWSSVTGATSYTLQEDNDDTFSSPTTVYDHGPGTSWDAIDKEPELYYYRVKATGAGGDSPWSNVQLIVVPAVCNPWIEFTFVPPYGSTQNLRGRVGCVIPADYKVAVFIYVAGWWNKPYWASPLTPIAPDGTWVTDITTGGNDPLATQIAAFLVPNGYVPPQLGGASSLPTELFAFPYVIVERHPPRSINFSGRTWYVKVADWNADPGPCYYSDRPEDVWVDASGRLHLTLTYRNYRWYCTEIFATQPSGYGVYSFDLASRVDQLDKNVVLGLFTYDDTSSAYSHREIDIEFSRWGVAAGPNAQYVVQPYTSPGHRHQFDLNLPSVQSTHTFTWTVGSAQFASYAATNPTTPLHAYSHVDSDIPPAGNGNPRINLWLFNGAAPSNGANVEVIIESFTFTLAGQESQKTQLTPL
jgi:hypothetical protein